MPLVTLTCDAGIYPPDTQSGGMLNDAQEGILGLAVELPYVIALNAIGLGLNPDETPDEGTQVDIRKFHVQAVNTSQLWVHAQFIEPYPGEIEAKRVREVFTTLVRSSAKGLIAPPIELSWSFDLIWTPGHGRIVPSRSSDQPEIIW